MSPWAPKQVPQAAPVSPAAARKFQRRTASARSPSCVSNTAPNSSTLHAETNIAAIASRRARSSSRSTPVSCAACRHSPANLTCSASLSRASAASRKSLASARNPDWWPAPSAARARRRKPSANDAGEASRSRDGTFSGTHTGTNAGPGACVDASPPPGLFFLSRSSPTWTTVPATAECADRRCSRWRPGQGRARAEPSRS